MLEPAQSKNKNQRQADGYVGARLFSIKQTYNMFSLFLPASCLEEVYLPVRAITLRDNLLRLLFGLVLRVCVYLAKYVRELVFIQLDSRSLCEYHFICYVITEPPRARRAD